jgi:hypothetical protein
MKHEDSIGSMSEQEEFDKNRQYDLQEEAYYVHTVNAFVELIVLYGWDKVTSDLRSAMGAKEW